MANLIADHKKGDTWDGFSFLFEELVNDIYVPFNLTGVTALIQFKTNPLGNAVFEFKTSDGTITIPTPLTGQIYMMPRVMNYEALTYSFDVQLTFLDGTVKTYVNDNFRIVQDISR
jgi:hypothetical protein